MFFVRTPAHHHDEYVSYSLKLEKSNNLLCCAIFIIQKIIKEKKRKIKIIRTYSPPTIKATIVE